MWKARAKAAKNIKDQIPNRPKPIFYIVTKYVKAPHVTKQVPEPSVEKHVREKREDLLPRCEVLSHLGRGVPNGNKPIDEYKFLEGWALGHLDKKDKNI